MKKRLMKLSEQCFEIEKDLPENRATILSDKGEYPTPEQALRHDLFLIRCKINEAINRLPQRLVQYEP